MLRTRLLPPSLLVAAGLLAVVAPCVFAGAAAQQTYQLEETGWDEVDPPKPGSPEAQLVEARRLIAEGETKAAVTALDAWIEAHPEHPRRPDAYLARGDAKLAAGRYFDSLFDYEAVIRSFPASPRYHDAIERELTVARLFSSGVKRKLLGMRILTAYGEAEEIYIRIQERSPGSEIGEEASIALADHYFNRGEMANAATAYELFLENYPKSDRREHAMLRLIEANLARFKGPRFDATGLVEAAERLRTFQDAYPAAAERIGAEALFVRIDESLALKALVQGRWYEKRDQPVSAIYLYRRVVEDYPATAAARRALTRLEELDAGFADTADRPSAEPAPSGTGTGPDGESPS